MQIIRTEKVRFSDCEIRNIEVVINLMEGIVNCAQDPELVKIANAACNKLTDIYEYMED